VRFKVHDARRVLSFCLDRACDLELGEDGARCSVRISPREEGAPSHLFEGDTFEEALRAAAAAGLVRSECIERQIAFARSSAERTFDARAGQWRGPAFPTAAELEEPTPVPDRELDIAHYRGLAEFRYQIRRFVSFSEKAAREAGLEPPQHQLLLAIGGLPPPRRANMATLAERMCIDLPACEALAQGVLDRGLVRWTVNQADRREKLLALTDAGQTLLRQLTVLHRNQMLAVGPTFVQALGAILSSFEQAD
jgi:DNA-binding MarR family transcriptional regulator